MGKETNISWADHTFNPWWGCTAVSPGCDFCYAEAFDKRVGGAHWGTGQPRREFGEVHWNEPYAWNALAAAEEKEARVFCLSMGDVMDPEAPAGARERLWAVINQTRWLRWLLLTKRPALFPRYLPAGGFRYDNVMLGATTEAQPYFEQRMPLVKAAAHELNLRNVRARGVLTDARVQTFASYEPALGPIRFSRYAYKPDWLIFGGETGPNPRPMDLAWARDIKADCEAMGTAFWMKQMSARTTGAAANLVPVDMLIRQLPEVR